MSEDFTGHLLAEAKRLKNSASAYFSFVGLIFGLLTVVLSFGSRASGFESAGFSWQVLYFTGMAAPLMMLLAALSEFRDRKARNGGVHWRGVSVKTLQFFRLVGVAVVSAIFQVFSFGSVVLFAGAPLLKAVIAALYSWIGSLALIGFGAIIARWSGVIGALIVGLIWQVLGMIYVETSWWKISPPSWSIRILLEPIGVNANGTPIEAHHPVLAESSAYGVTGCLVMGAAAFALATVTASRTESSVLHEKLRSTFHLKRHRLAVAEVESMFGAFSQSSEERQPTHFPLQAIFLAQRGSGAIVFVLITVCILVFVSIVYDTATASSVFTFLVFPVGAGTLPILTWRKFSGPYALLHVHNPSSLRIFLVSQFLYLLTVTVVFSCSLVVSGADFMTVFHQFVLWSILGMVIINSSLTAAVKFGYGAALALIILGTIISLTLGGDVLSDTSLWFLAVSAWPEISLSEHRFVYALGLGLALVWGTTWGLSQIMRKERAIH